MANECTQIVLAHTAMTHGDLCIALDGIELDRAIGSRFPRSVNTFAIPQCNALLGTFGIYALCKTFEARILASITAIAIAQSDADDK